MKDYLLDFYTKAQEADAFLSELVKNDIGLNEEIGLLPLPPMLQETRAKREEIRDSFRSKWTKYYRSFLNLKSSDPFLVDALQLAHPVSGSYLREQKTDRLHKDIKLNIYKLEQYQKERQLWYSITTTIIHLLRKSIKFILHVPSSVISLTGINPTSGLGQVIIFAVWLLILWITLGDPFITLVSKLVSTISPILPNH